MMRSLKGFQDKIVLVASGGLEAISLSIWDLKEDAETYGRGTYREVVKAMAKVVRVLLELKPARFQPRPFTRSPPASQPDADRSFLFDSGRPSPPLRFSGKTPVQDSPAEAHLRIANGAGNKTPSATSAGSSGR
jgi:hypothetical protein